VLVSWHTEFGSTLTITRAREPFFSCSPPNSSRLLLCLNCFTGSSSIIPDVWSAQLIASTQVCGKQTLLLVILINVINYKLILRSEGNCQLPGCLSVSKCEFRGVCRGVHTHPSPWNEAFFIGCKICVPYQSVTPFLSCTPPLKKILGLLLVKITINLWKTNKMSKTYK